MSRIFGDLTSSRSFTNPEKQSPIIKDISAKGETGEINISRIDDRGGADRDHFAIAAEIIRSLNGMETCESRAI